MSVRAVVVPATPLLVPGAAGSARVLSGVRRVVDDALAQLVTDARGGTLLVLAHGARAGVGPPRRGRPSLEAAGVPDAWVPAVLAWPGAPGEVVGVGASVALICLADALAAAGEPERLDGVVVREVPRDGVGVDDACRDVGRASGVVVAGGGAPGSPDNGSEAMAPGVDRVLKHMTTERGWAPEVRTVTERREHLPVEYHVTLWRG